MDKQKILMVIGSLRRQSLNRQLAEAGAELLKDQAEVSVLDYTRLPFINPDMEFPVPDEVQKIRDRISGADGVWIFFPEYNYSYPGALKNLLDWISRPTAQGAPRTTAVSSEKPVTYSSVSGSASGTKALEKMYELLKKIHMDIMAEPVVSIREPKTTDGKLELSEEEKGLLKEQAEAFLKFIKEKNERKNK